MKKILLGTVAFFFLFWFPVCATENDAKVSEIALMGWRTFCYGDEYTECGEGQSSSSLMLTVEDGKTLETNCTGSQNSILLDIGASASFSYRLPEKAPFAIYDDPCNKVNGVCLTGSVRHGTIIVEKRMSNGQYDTVASAADVFLNNREAIDFYKPSYDDIREGVTYRITVLYASRIGETVVRYTELYYVQILVEPLGLIVREALPEEVLFDILPSLDPYLVEYATRGGMSCLVSGAVTPYGFYLENYQGATVSYNGGPWTSASGQQYSDVGHYKISSEGKISNVYVTPQKKEFFQYYFPQGVVDGMRLLALESDIPVYSVGCSVRGAKGTVPLTVQIESSDGESYQIGEALPEGFYIVCMADSNTDLLSGTATEASYCFRVSATGSSINRMLLENNYDIIQMKPLHIQVRYIDAVGKERIVVFSSSSDEEARKYAERHAGMLSYNLFDRSLEKSSYEWASVYEREFARAEVVVLPPDFVFLSNPDNEYRVLLRELQSGFKTYLIPGVCVGKQLQNKGFYEVTESTPNGMETYYVLYLGQEPSPVVFQVNFEGGSPCVPQKDGRYFSCSTLCVSVTSFFDDEVVLLVHSEDGQTSFYEAKSISALKITRGSYTIRIYTRNGYHPQTYHIQVADGAEGVADVLPVPSTEDGGVKKNIPFTLAFFSIALLGTVGILFCYNRKGRKKT